MVYYNENNLKMVDWLWALMKAGLIPKGDIDERSIKEVKASDLKGYRQCHFFAGIGGWAKALQIAGVGTAENVWTGSCPCQPYSSAGKRQAHEYGAKHARHFSWRSG